MSPTLPVAGPSSRQSTKTNPNSIFLEVLGVGVHAVGIFAEPGEDASDAQLVVTDIGGFGKVERVAIDLSDVTNSWTNKPWYFDYNYNQNLGSNLSGAGVAPSYQANGTGITMSNVRFPKVPQQTMILGETREIGDKNDFVFSKIVSMVPRQPNGTANPLVGIANNAHEGQKKMNMLYIDGQIICDNIDKIGGTPSMNWILNFRDVRNNNFPF